MAQVDTKRAGRGLPVVWGIKRMNFRVLSFRRKSVTAGAKLSGCEPTSCFAWHRHMQLPQKRAPAAAGTRFTFGMMFGFVFVPLPQLLTQQGVPGDRIAVAVILSPVFWNFVFAPSLDVSFRRRTYALIFGTLAITATANTVIHHASLVEAEAVMVVGVFLACMFGSAIGAFLFVFADAGQPEVRVHDSMAQKELLRARFAADSAGRPPWSRFSERT